MDAQTKLVLQDLSGVGERLMQAADDNEWDAVTELMLEQKKLVSRLFEGGARAQLAADISVELRTVQTLTDRVIELAKKHKHELVDAAGAVQLGRAAARAYSRESADRP